MRAAAALAPPLPLTLLLLLLVLLLRPARATFVQTGTPIPGPNVGSLAGSSLALSQLSALDVLLAIGAPYQITPGVSVYASTDLGSTWSPLTVFDCCPTAPTISLYRVPYALSFSGDGQTLLVGMAGSTGSTTSGATVYKRETNGSWTAADTDLTCTTQPDANMGTSVALSSDATVAWVGTLGELCYTELASGTGPKARPFEYSTLLAASLATSAQGNVVVVGLVDTSLSKAFPFGAITIISTGTAESQVIAGPVANFGTSVSMTADNSTIAVGACNSSVFIYVFAFGGSSNWALAQTLTAPSGATSNSTFGCSVALSASGYLLSVGSANGAGVGSGQAFAYYRGVSGQYAFDQTLLPNPSAISFGATGLAALDSGIVAGGAASGGATGETYVFRAIPTATPTPSATATGTSSASATASASALATATSSATASASSTATGTVTRTATHSANATASATSSGTSSATATSSATSSSSASATGSASATATATSTSSGSSAATFTASGTGSATATTTSTPTPSSSIIPLAANSTTFIATVATASVGGLIALVGLGWFVLSWLRRPATGKVTRTLFPVRVESQSPWTLLGGGGGGGAEGPGLPTGYDAAAATPDYGSVYRALSPAEGAGGVGGLGAAGGGGGGGTPGAQGSARRANAGLGFVSLL